METEVVSCKSCRFLEERSLFQFTKDFCKHFISIFNTLEVEFILDGLSIGNPLNGMSLERLKHLARRQVLPSKTKRNLDPFVKQLSLQS